VSRERILVEQVPADAVCKGDPILTRHGILSVSGVRHVDPHIALPFSMIDLGAWPPLRAVGTFYRVVPSPSEQLGDIADAARTIVRPEPRTWTLVRLSNSDSWCIAAGDVEARPEGLVDVVSGIIVVESVPVIEKEPILDQLEATRPTDGRAWKLAPDALVDAVVALLRTHGRLKGAGDE
jgi:hypothetical protein